MRMYHDVFQTFQAFCRVESAPARKCGVGFCWFLFLGFSVRSRRSRRSRRSQGPDFAGHSRASATRLLIFHVTQEVIVGAYFLRFQLFTYHHIST